MILPPQVRHAPHLQSGAQLVCASGAHGGPVAEEQRSVLLVSREMCSSYCPLWVVSMLYTPPNYHFNSQLLLFIVIVVHTLTNTK